MSRGYYLLCNPKEGKPYLVGLYSRLLVNKAREINWMITGELEPEDFRYVQRVSMYEYKCRDTNEIFEIRDKGSYTQEAWEKFLYGWSDQLLG